VILDKEIKLIATSKIMSKLKEIGIIIKYNDEIILPIEKLWLGSNYKIKVKCDICGTEKMLNYSLYNKNIKKYNIYCCSNVCAWVKNKKTNLEKYGEENYFNLEKYKETCLEKYGVEFPITLNENIKKSEETKLKKYGDINYNNRRKYKETCLEKYGVENPLLNENIKEKTRETNLKNMVLKIQGQQQK